LGAGVIQHKELNKYDINNIFSVSIYLGVLLMFLFLLFSYPISIIYNDTIYLKLCPILAVSVLFNSFNMIPNAMMLKEKKFKNIAKRTFVSCVVSYSFSIGLALYGWGVYALCLSQVMSSITIFVWNQLSVKLKFIIKPGLAAVKNIWNYSFYQFISQTINYFCRTLDNFLIGFLFSKEQLAYYNKSYTLMMLPISHIPGVINPVLHPILSEFQNDKNIIFTKYMRVIRFLSIVGCIVTSVCFLFGEYIIYFMFGSQWGESIAPFRILSLSILPQLLLHTAGAIYQSTGETKMLFKSVVISTFIILSSIVIGTLFGSIVSVAFFVSIAYILNFFVSFYLLIEKIFHAPFTEFLRTLFPEIIMIIAVIAGDFFIDTATHALIIKIMFLCILTFIYLYTGDRMFFLIKIFKRK